MAGVISSTNYGNYFTHYITKNFASSLLSIFIPIYLYANGFSLFQVGIFYLIQEIINFIFTFILYQKIHFLGVRNITIAAIIAQIIAVVLTYHYLSPVLIFLLLLAFMRAIHDSFYWGTYGIYMVHLSGKKTGNFLGKWYFFTTLVQIAIIPLSGYILDNYQPFWLLLFSIILYSLSIIPLFKIKLTPLNNNRKVGIVSLLKEKENQFILFISHLNEFFTKINDSLMPLFIFFIFGKFFTIGIAAIFAAFGGGIYSFFIGNKSDQKKMRKKLLLFNSISYLLVIVILIFIQNFIYKYFIYNYLVFIIVLILAFFRIGIIVSSETGINKNCQNSFCYSKKLMSRLGENIAGIFIGMTIMVAGLTNFTITFIICSIYIFLVILTLFLKNEII